jgi:Putative helicase
MQSVEAMTERILYWLSLDMQVQALAERLLQRFAVTVGDLPASAAHHHAEPGGLYRHSLEVALKAYFRIALLQRHHSERISCPRTASDDVPGSGDQRLRAWTANMFSIGWWSARLKRLPSRLAGRRAIIIRWWIEH